MDLFATGWVMLFTPDNYVEAVMQSRHQQDSPTSGKCLSSVTMFSEFPITNFWLPTRDGNTNRYVVTQTALLTRVSMWSVKKNIRLPRMLTNFHPLNTEHVLPLSSDTHIELKSRRDSLNIANRPCEAYDGHYTLYQYCRYVVSLWNPAAWIARQISRSCVVIYADNGRIKRAIIEWCRPISCYVTQN